MTIRFGGWLAAWGWLALASWAGHAAADQHALDTFERRQLTDVYYSEGAGAGDIDGDGHGDAVYGPYWFAGPDFGQRHEIYPPAPQPRERYADNFFSWVRDFNGDGRNDIFVVGFPGTPAYVYENPPASERDRHWPKHQVFDWVSNESPHFTNLVGDERPELVCTRDGFFGFATVDWSRPFEAWKFHAISDKSAATKFGHGLGVGDVSGDGLLDVIHANGWFEQPATGALDTRWKAHQAKFTNRGGGAEMYAYDVDGDGDNDIITSLAAHDFGLAWYEQTLDGGERTFREHLIMGETPEQNRYGLVFSELHSVNLADIDGDGLKDIVTGKTYWSHHQQSPMWDTGAVVYWFRLVRSADGVDWVPYLAEADSGIGRQVTIADINGDKLDDIVLGGMKGANVLLHHRREVSEQEWSAAQPKVFVAAAGRPAARVAPAATAAIAADAVFPPPASFLPTDSSGRPLNFDFETGTLDDWTIEGEAFSQQPVKGGIEPPRRPGMASQHQGDFWIGGYERLRDRPIGRLVSRTFKVTHPWASFLMNGGSQEGTRVELVRANSGQPFFAVAGTNRENMRPVYIDLRGLAGQEIFIRLVDEVSGGWGHLNFDNFVFHESSPGRATAALIKLVADDYPHAGLSAEDAARAMKLPEGFSVTVAAAEPHVLQPIAMALDDRGRVWIAEAFEYPQRAPEGKGRDRIVIFEDADGDGKLESRKVFAEGLNLVSGLEVGFGGVWVGAAPYLLFIPDADGDDVPDAAPKVLLDGWGYEDTHETLNTFIWGPDGWLYGCHGVFTHSKVGKPGTPDDERIGLNAGIWRYHPTRHTFEVFAHGTSNPWGVDFNDRGQAFCTACVIPHLFHIIQHARYQRQAGTHFNPHTYDDIKTIADHLHYLGATPHSGNDKSDEAGGGHAHAGAMIYLGGAWPERYRDQLIMNNIHGQRLNMDTPAARGSGYVGGHGPDFLLTGDRASQILNLRYGPDGNAYMIDWYDMQACHLRDPARHDRGNGRIYKISYGKSEPVSVDLNTLNDRGLAALVMEENDWYVRHARRIMQERYAAGYAMRGARTSLAEIAIAHADDTRRLRAMWALHVTGGVPAELTSRLLNDPSPYVRGWAIQLAMEQPEKIPSELVARFEVMAREDDSPVARLYLASAAQRLPPAARWGVLEGLVSHSADAADHNLPLMYWYAAEPLADADPERALAFGLSAGKTIPLVRDFMLRRIGSGDSAAAIGVLVGGLRRAEDAALQLTFLRAIRLSLRGQRQATPPAEWKNVFASLSKSADEEVRREAMALGVTFGEGEALAAFRSTAADTSAATEARLSALDSLLGAKDAELAPALLAMLEQPAMRDAALRGLAQYDDPRVADRVLAVYAGLSPGEKRTALATLCSRAATGVALLRAVEREEIATSDLSADLVRQLHYLKNADIDQLLGKVWGSVRETAADKAEMIASLRSLLANASAPPADVALGRAVFAKTCQRCHVLYGAGAKIGPDLTGSNRANLDYLLSNIVDPSAVMAKEYQPTIIVTTDGRIVTGLVASEDTSAVTLRTADAVVIIPKAEIDERVLGDKSMMPDDQLKQFSEHEVRSLLAYLGGNRQAPLLATADNAAQIFNGQDLANWSGNAELWSVENGEIVGKTAGLKKNEFLISDFTADDFRLTLDIKLVDNAGNSGVQFRSQVREDGLVMGYQADAGVGWWGKLYEEHGRALLWKESGERHVRPGEWNTYTIAAVGSRVRTWINGQPCADLDDPAGARRGVFALQLHSGGPTEVRFRNFRLEVLTPPDTSRAATATAFAPVRGVKTSPIAANVTASVGPTRDAQAEAAWTSHGLPAAGREAIRRTFRNGIDYKFVPGGALLIIHRGEPVFREAFGVVDLETQAPFTIDTPCRIASITKPHTTTLLAMLVDEGKLAWDDTIDKYLPYFAGIKVRGRGAAKRMPRVRELVSHTAGFPGQPAIDSGKWTVKATDSLADAVEDLPRQGLATEPGTVFAYTGFGYMVAGRIAEVVTGQDYATLMHDRLLAAIGATTATFEPSTELMARVPTPYMRHNGDFEPVDLSTRPEAVATYPNPAGRLISTLDDVGRFLMLHRDRGMVGETRVISEAALRELYKPQLANQPQGYGLGFNILKTGPDGVGVRIRHTGASGTFAQLDFESDLAVVILTQVPQTQTEAFRGHLLKAIGAVFESKTEATNP